MTDRAQIWSKTLSKYYRHIQMQICILKKTKWRPLLFCWIWIMAITFEPFNRWCSNLVSFFRQVLQIYLSAKLLFPKKQNGIRCHLVEFQLLLIQWPWVWIMAITLEPFDRSSTNLVRTFEQVFQTYSNASLYFEKNKMASVAILLNLNYGNNFWTVWPSNVKFGQNLWTNTASI